MFSKKNIIFIPPLAPDLEELFTFYTEGEDKDKYEVLEVSSLAEANQLIPTLGPALILTSAAKTCALMLKANKNYLKNFKSKVILVTPQNIPEKTINKLMKVGLNDFVQCPTNQKSLHYKCNLLLQALPAQQLEEENVTEEVHLGTGDFEQNIIDTSQKQRIEKGIIEDAPKGEIKQQEIKDINLNIINTTMDNKKTRGALDLKLEFSEEDDSKTNLTAMSDDDLLKAKSLSEINLNLEKSMPAKEQSQDTSSDELNLKRATQVDLAISSTSTQRESLQQHSEETESQTIGKEQTELEINSDKQQKSVDLQIAPSNSSSSTTDILPEEVVPQKSSERTDIDKTENPEQSKSENVNLLINKSSKSEDHTTDQAAEDEIEKIKEELALEIEQEELKKKREQQEATISATIKSDTTELTEENSNDKEKRTNLYIEKQAPKKEQQREEKELNYNRSSKKPLPENELDYRKNKATHALQVEEESSEENLDLDLDSKQSNTSIGQQNTTEEELAKNRADIALDIDSSSKKSGIIKKQEKETKTKKQNATLEINKKSKGFTEEINLEVMKGESKVEHLDNRFKSKKHHGELKIDFEKKKRGIGDTIDYSKIKKEYKDLAHALRTLDEEALAKIKKRKADKLYSKPTVFEPHSKGVEHLIELSILYQNPSKPHEDIIFALGQKIQQLFRARLAIFIYNQEEDTFKTFFENFDSFLEASSDPENRWKHLVLVNYENWNSVTTPSWKDEHFTQKENEFIFPFYQDSVKQGFSIIHFPENIKANQAALVETLLESIRGILIQCYKEAIGEEVKTNIPTDQENKEQHDHLTKNKQQTPTTNKKRGLLAKLFG